MYVIDIIRRVIYFVLLFVCAFTDYKEGKIYNKNLLRFLIAFAFIYCIEYVLFVFIDKTCISRINTKLIDELLGFAIAFVIGFAFYFLGIFKGGDAKLLSIVGLISGKNQIWMHFSIIMIVAGVVALYVLIKNKVLFKRLKRVYLYLKGLVFTKQYEKYTSDDDKIKFPFAIYILAGEIVSYIVYFLRG